MYYELTEPFNDHSAGTVFKRISVYGEDHIEACKLEALTQGGVDTKRLNVTDDELDEQFVETDVPSAEPTTSR